jgi:hypothetical protein
MMDREKSPEEQRLHLFYACLAGPYRTLGLARRIPELLRKRGWPIDQDLVSVLGGAVALKKIGAGRQPFRRPPLADRLGGMWPADSAAMTASQIVERFELQELLQAR